MNKESEVMKRVKSLLDLLEYQKVIIWYERLNSGKVQVGYSWIQMARKGTSDWIIVLRNKEKSLSVLFVECKSDVGTLRPEQKKFRDGFDGIKDIYYFIIRDSKELGMLIRQIGFDKSQEEIDAIVWPSN